VTADMKSNGNVTTECKTGQNLTDKRESPKDVC
jgi:hypothetical protein